MSPRRRTLCFVLIFLSVNNDLDFVGGLPVGPVVTEFYPCPASPSSILTVTSGPGNRVCELPGVPQQFPTQRFNEVFSFGSYPPGLSINTVATTNYGAIQPFTTYTPYETSNFLPIVETITESLPYPPNFESVTIVENCPPAFQTIQVEGFYPTANVAEIYQTPITVQIPSMPQLSPFIDVALPEISPSQNIIEEIYTPNVFPEICPQTIETITSVPVETTTFNIPSCDVGCGGQQSPVTLQIYVTSPCTCIPESGRTVISQPASAPCPVPFFDPSFSMPPAPIIVMKKSKSKLKSILPILMLSLFDGGCGNNCGGGGGCGCSSTSTPIPFPILIPTNSPVITCGRSKGKGKASTDAQS